MNNQEYDLTYTDLNPTFLYVCDLERTETEEKYHSHEYIEIAVITKGKGMFHIDGINYPVSSGDLIILNPGTYHKSIVTDVGELMTEYYTAFTDINIKNTEPNTLPLIGGNHILPLTGKIKQEIMSLCSSMAKESLSGKSGRYFMLKSYAIQLIILLLRQQEDTVNNNEGYIFTSPNQKYVVKQMIRYFNEHYREKISLDDIAQNMYLSTFYLSKVFKSTTGDTPINYLIELRMNKAKDLMLESPTLSIQDVALMVGYDDAYHFSKLFKKHFGIAPSVYKGIAND